ncbi:hypothetical protein RO3G_10223 [Rhizopus delemar RA 99-880]|uniref:Uncharacterized protein n=1 Tax=Rhizopus delemar (strain RA 99-880 / ATCC MYA-4621 / FGSC 9543 / NRRL 43880) TaxID=246409 RepID=I1CAN3_RHIO9|nr:hypothetical protein RO3G_10223 [Rhizopus delemar RA 99-880]|eukprot:EIE85513.1 hypothetical protein RO3G_10223 [Rhizopus delemar RA 99-880]
MGFIEAYSRCTDGREVVQEVKKFVEKKYLSHRKVRVPSDLTLWLLLFPAVSNLLLLWILVTTGSLLFMGFIYYALLFAASMVKNEPITYNQYGNKAPK